jgi:hypothetical protein
MSKQPRPRKKPEPKPEPHTFGKLVIPPNVHIKDSAVVKDGWHERPIPGDEDGANANHR